MKNIFLKNGKNLELKIGIHTGSVTSAVVGELKPQFSLYGETILRTVNIT
jgi:class 3 adenylate cyclase